MTDLSPTFSDPAPVACPECGGANIPNHPGGWLYFKHDTLGGCSLQDAEDATQAADKARGGGERPVTPTERTLLLALGYTLPEDATTTVYWLTPGVRGREWPAAVAVTP